MKGKQTLDAALIESPGNTKILTIMEEMEKMGEESSQDIPFLIENGTMTKDFYESLIMIFERFDIDKDGMWNEKELATFYGKVNEEPIPASVIEFLQTNFSTSEQGWLLPEGLMEFYLCQDPEETWRDLNALGFDDTLQVKKAEP